MLALVVEPVFGIDLNESVVFQSETAEGALERFAKGLGGWAFVFAPMLMMVVAILPIPAEIPAMLNGMLFGPVLGTFMSWSGAVVGAVISFELARRFGRNQLDVWPHNTRTTYIPVDHGCWHLAWGDLVYRVGYRVGGYLSYEPVGRMGPDRCWAACHCVDGPPFSASTWSCSSRRHRRLKSEHPKQRSVSVLDRRCMLSAYPADQPEATE